MSDKRTVYGCKCASQKWFTRKKEYEEHLAQHEPTFTQAEVEQLIEAIAARIEGVSGFRQKPWGYERAANERGDEVGDFLFRSEVLDAIRSTKI